MTAMIRTKCLAAAWAVLTMPWAWSAAANLENPPPDRPVSGISLISGWHCDAKRVEIALDGGDRIGVPYGTSRADTAAACGGNTATGFGYLVNWGNAGAGSHVIVAYADGIEFARRTFNVLAVGPTPFITGVKRSVRVDHFPELGRSVILEWNQGMQAFTPAEVRFDAPGLAGTWTGADLERRSGCARPENNGNHGTTGQYTIAFAGSSFSIQQAGFTGLNCTYAGTYDPSDFTMTGTYSCSDGKTGTLKSTGMMVTEREMSIQLAIKLSGSESCTIDATLGGSRF